MKKTKNNVFKFKRPSHYTQTLRQWLTKHFLVLLKALHQTILFIKGAQTWAHLIVCVFQCYQCHAEFRCGRKPNQTEQDLTTGWVALRHSLASPNLHVSPEAAQEWRHVRYWASQNNAAKWGKKLGSGFVSPGREAAAACCDAEQALVMLEQWEVCWLKWKMVCLTPRSGSPPSPSNLVSNEPKHDGSFAVATIASWTSIQNHRQTFTF